MLLSLVSATSLARLPGAPPARPLACSPARALLSDRRALGDILAPRSFALAAVTHPLLALGEHLNSVSSSSEEQLEREMQALLAPFDPDPNAPDVPNPWPGILKSSAYNCGFEFLSNLLVWGLEEAAIGYFTATVADDLTKDPHNTARRELEKGESSRVAVAAGMVPVVIKAKALRYLSWYALRSLETTWRIAKAWYGSRRLDTAAAAAAAAEQQPAGAADHPDQALARPVLQRAVAVDRLASTWAGGALSYLQFTLYFPMRCIADGVVCGAITLVLPVNLLSGGKTRKLWVMLNTLGMTMLPVLASSLRNNK